MINLVCIKGYGEFILRACSMPGPLPECQKLNGEERENCELRTGSCKEKECDDTVRISMISSLSIIILGTSYNRICIWPLIKSGLFDYLTGNSTLRLHLFLRFKNSKGYYKLTKFLIFHPFMNYHFSWN